MLFDGQRKTREQGQEISGCKGALPWPVSRLEAALPAGFEKIEAFISQYLKYIDFRYCYYALLGSAGSVVLSFVLWRITIIPPVLLQVLQQLSALIINLYVNMGYVKYSYLEDERLFRRIIIVVAGFSLLGSALLLVAPLLPVGKAQSTIFIALPVYLTAPLLFYGFRLIRTEESPFFATLAGLNIFLFLTGILWAFLSVPWLASYPLIFLLMLVSAGTFASIWFLKLRLFYHLSGKWPGATLPNA